MVKGKKITGYRLHKERILFSGGQVIRTIKFPLVPIDDKSEEGRRFLEQFEKAVIEDDLKIRGDLNLNDYLTHTAAGKTRYTLFDFWIDSLKAGVIWRSKGKELIDFFSSNAIDLIWEKGSSNITDYFEKNQFKEILKSIPVRKGQTTRKSFYKRIVNCVKKEFLVKNKDGTYEVIEPKIAKEINSIVDTFFDENDNLILEGKFQQSKFWKDKYNLDVSILQAAQPPGEYKDITFIIIPELILDDLSKNYPLEELIARREKWLKEFKGSEKDIESILCLTDNFNGFNNYLGKIFHGLQSGKLEEVFEAQKKIFPSIEQNKLEVMNALQFLSEKSKLLDEVNVSVVNGWHEYRSVFGGKIKSWFSNSQKRKDELDKQIANFQEGLKKAKTYFENEKFDEEAQQERKDILELLNLLEQFFTDDTKSIKIEENYLIFISLLALVKRRLNFFYQAYIQKEGEEKKVNNFEPFKGLYEKIHKPVAFYGNSARRANEKFVHKTIPILEDGIANIQKLTAYLQQSFSPKDIFEEVKKEKDTGEDAFRKALQFFWEKHSEGMLNSPDFRKKYEEILKVNTDEGEWQELNNKENKGKYVYYKSPYAKGTLSEIKLKAQDTITNEYYLEKLRDLYLKLSHDLLSYNKDSLLRDTKVLLDWIELAKNILGALLRFNTKKEFELKDLLLDNFEKAKNYVERFPKNQYSKNEYSFIIQSLILSEIRGAATLYAKKDYTAKYTVQIVGSDDKFKLYYIPKDESVSMPQSIADIFPSSEERKLLMGPHYYATVLGKVAEKKEAEAFNSLRFTKNGFYPVSISNWDKSKIFRLTSSPYQLQFLDKFLYRPKGWEDIEIGLSEWSFVVERRFKIEWDLETKKPKLLPVTEGDEAKKNKLYVAIPFTLKFKEIEEDKQKIELQKEKPKRVTLKDIINGDTKEKQDRSRLNYPILGVDVGEYGLAYCLVRFHFNNDGYRNLTAVEIVKDKKTGKPICGFIEDRNIGNIKDKFAEIQKRARLGTFDEEDTTVAKVRENAVGALRNRVHVIVTQGSSVVYEDSISNFETGSGRTTKIYNSVKRADTEHESEADKNIHKHVWGEGTKWAGRNVSAYASSYTCIKCLHSLYEIKKEDLNSVKVVVKKGRIVTMTTPFREIKVKGYLSEKEKYEVGYQFKATDEDLKAFRKIVRDFARPPVSSNTEVLNEFVSDLLSDNKLESFKNKRGSSSVFVCPFCHFVADADIQAAFMMAVRGYLRFSGIVPPDSESATNKSQKSEKTTGESFLERTKEILGKQELKPYLTAIAEALALKL